MCSLQHVVRTANTKFNTNLSTSYCLQQTNNIKNFFRILELLRLLPHESVPASMLSIFVIIEMALQPFVRKYIEQFLHLNMCTDGQTDRQLFSPICDQFMYFTQIVC
jgi:hypothetical protein